MKRPEIADFRGAVIYGAHETIVTAPEIRELLASRQGNNMAHAQRRQRSADDIPRNWRELELQARQQAAYFADGANRAESTLTNLLQAGAATVQRYGEAQVMHEQRTALHHTAQITYLGARAARLEGKTGAFTPGEVEKRAAEASRAGQVINHFVTAAALLTGTPGQLLTLLDAALPPRVGADTAITTGLRVLRQQQQQSDTQLLSTGAAPDYTPPHPRTIMRVVTGEVPQLPRIERDRMRRRLKPYLPN